MNIGIHGTMSRWMMKAVSMTFICIYCLFFFTPVRAQEIIVTVAPTQPVMPPQGLLYVSDPGKFFTIQLTNTTAQSQQVYLGMQLEQLMPNSVLALSTPPNRQPLQPIIVPANGQATLSLVDTRHLFDHLSTNEINAPTGLMSGYFSGRFGLLPEGQYQVHFTAYRWSQSETKVPMVVSNPTGGSCIFNVCYQAQAPTFQLPTLLGTKVPDVAEVDPFSALFSWIPPVLTCNHRAMRFEYSLRVVEIPTGWSLDQAMDHGPLVYQRNGLTVPQCIIPQNIITQQFYTNKRYAAQVTAKTTTLNPLDYIMIANSGKSRPVVFRIKTSDEPFNLEESKEEVAVVRPKVVDKPKTVKDRTKTNKVSKTGQKEKAEDKKVDNEGKDASLAGIAVLANANLVPDSLYTFRNPMLTAPLFEKHTGARKQFMEDVITVKWDRAKYLGGSGSQPDALAFDYEVQLFRSAVVNQPDQEKTLSSNPIFTTRTKGQSVSIPWERIRDKVEPNDYLVLRVKPIVTKGNSVAFVNDSVNVTDFALARRMSSQNTPCSSSMVINNTRPTTKGASDLRGKAVRIGEYQLTIDKISGTANAGFSGEGRVEWKPFGSSLMVCVKFDKLKINSDNVVYDGVCTTYSDKPESDLQTIDRLFSDWGFDHLIGDIDIPFANYLQGEEKDLAKKANLSKYFGYVKTGNAEKQQFLTGKMDYLYLPIALPKSINSSPVDIQIASMKFTPTWAAMDLIGELSLPNTNYMKNDFLVFGAPRVCMSPTRFLPENGQIPLLSNFELKDPKTSYEMKFRAPSNLTKCEDGCVVSWKDNKMELLGLDMEIMVPNMVKSVNGMATNERSTLKVRTAISSWDDWMLEGVTLDPFQLEDLPGWTFTPEDVIFDHSLYRNSSRMADFPTGYKKNLAGVSSPDGMDWQGLFIKKVRLDFPKSMEMNGGNSRLQVSSNDLFIDRSGATLVVADRFNASAGKIGGWDFSINNLSLTFMQNDFSKCRFSGKIDVPLLNGQIDYECQLLKQTSNPDDAGQYAYVFRTQRLSGLSLNFFLADATFKKDQTYIVLESSPEAKGNSAAKVELLLGGNLSIGGSNYLYNRIKDSTLPMKFDLPGIHFNGMRLSNRPNSTETSQVKEFAVANNQLYFHSGRWSFPSAQRELGPFQFSPTKYTVDVTDTNPNVSIEGNINLVSGTDMSGNTGFGIYTEVGQLKNLYGLKGVSLNFNRTYFKRATIATNLGGILLDGRLSVNSGASGLEGYQGDLTFRAMGNLFSVTANGGFFRRRNSAQRFTYGWFYGSAPGKMGITSPLKITPSNACFYFNCRKNGTPEEGFSGAVASLELSTTGGKDLFSGNFDMTVAYDRSHNRLTDFLMSGKLQAVNELVKANTNLFYLNDSRNQFITLDVTADAVADAMAATMMKRVPMDSLEYKIDYNPSLSRQASMASKQGINMSPTAVVKTGVQFMASTKKNGKLLEQPKWHLYLGEPSLAERCTYTFLRMNNGDQNVNLSGNGYVCVGNELPNDGKLPEIPYEIRRFLDGDNSNGQSAESIKAIQARERSLKEFYDQCETNGGGVMFGSQVYGNFEVDLGLFYLNAGTTAGFDVNVVKLPASAFCIGVNGQPGYKGWYGNGQLYTNLNSKLGIRINQGYWKKDFDVADVGLGGSFRMQGPKPGHFDGEARIMMKLLGGKVGINRKYHFSVGESCDQFNDNPFRDFRLLGDLSIGWDTKEKGWADKNKIDPTLSSRPVLYTEAPLKQPFRVLDETTLSRLQRNYNGDVNDLENKASRTFVFRSSFDTAVTLEEYASATSVQPTSTRAFNIKEQGGYASTFDITALNPNRYYKMTVTGYAKELVKGQEVNPQKWNEGMKRYVSEPWSQSKTYWFATTDRKELADVPNLQDYIAIAYPSKYNKIMQQPADLSYQEAHLQDVQRPTFALTADLSTKAFRKGKLKWRLYDRNDKLVSSRDNVWHTTNSTCNMQPVSAFSDVVPNECYRIKLEYETSRRDALSRISIETQVIADIWVKALSSTWQTGNNGSSLSYEAPFVGCRLNNVSWSDSRSKLEDYNLAADTRNALTDPYLYIAYLSNYAFPGGRQVDVSRIDQNVVTPHSVVYSDKGGVYEAQLGGKGDYERIKSLSIYDFSQWGSQADFPLPQIDDSRYSYVLPGLARAARYIPSLRNEVKVQGYIADMYSVYEACQRFSQTLNDYAKQMNGLVAGSNAGSRRSSLDNWYQAHRAQYVSASAANACLQVPAYQFPVLYGGSNTSTGTWLSRESFVPSNAMLKRMTKASFACYRVNTYDFNRCMYGVDLGVNGGNAFETFEISYPLTFYNMK